MLAGLGCVTQLCRIPEIGIRVVTQGAVPLLEKAIHRYEKIYYKLLYITCIFKVYTNYLQRSWVFYQVNQRKSTIITRLVITYSYVSILNIYLYC
jgi:hypothetical protein